MYMQMCKLTFIVDVLYVCFMYTIPFFPCIQKHVVEVNVFFLYHFYNIIFIDLTFSYKLLGFFHCEVLLSFIALDCMIWFIVQVPHDSCYGNYSENGISARMKTVKTENGAKRTNVAV